MRNVPVYLSHHLAGIGVNAFVCWEIADHDPYTRRTQPVHRLLLVCVINAAHGVTRSCEGPNHSLAGGAVFLRLFR
jgi:hypothetical protein